MCPTCNFFSRWGTFSIYEPVNKNRKRIEATKLDTRTKKSTLKTKPENQTRKQNQTRKHNRGDPMKEEQKR